MKTIDEVLNEDLADLPMCGGTGDGEHNACVMHQAAIAYALTHGLPWPKPTDECPGVPMTIQVLLIRANDAKWWRDDAERTATLRPFISLALAADGSLAAEVKRANLCAKVAKKLAAKTKWAAAATAANRAEWTARWAAEAVAEAVAAEEWAKAKAELAELAELAAAKAKYWAAAEAEAETEAKYWVEEAAKAAAECSYYASDRADLLALIRACCAVTGDDA